MLLILITGMSLSSLSSESPTLITPNDNAITWHQVIFSWSPVVGASYYEIQIDSSLNFDSNLLVDSLLETDASGVGTTFLYDHFHFGENYFWRVRTLTTTDTSLWSVTRSFFTRDTVHLVEPADGSLTYTRVYLDWDAYPGAQYYDYELDTSLNFNSPLLQAGFNNAFSEQNAFFDSQKTMLYLKHDAPYFWRVRPRNDLDTGAWNAGFFQTRVAPELTYPMGDTVGAGVVIDWNAFSGSTYYDYQYDTAATFQSAVLSGSSNQATSLSNSAADSEATLSQLYFNTHYYYRVRARHILDTSIWVSADFHTGAAVNLTSPANGSNLQAVEALLNWEPVAGVSQYEYQLDTTANFSSPNLTTGALAYINTYDGNADTEWMAADLFFGTAYFWRVRALNSVDTSAWSEIRSFITPAAPQLIYPLQGNNTFTGISFEWQAIEGSNLYYFEADTTTNFNSTQLFQATVTGNNTHYAEGLLFGTNYFWRVKAVGLNGESEWTAPEPFYTLDLVGLVSPSPDSLNVDSAILLDWKHHRGAINYQLQVDSSNTFATSFLIEEEFLYQGASDGLSDTEYLLQNLDSNRFYFWRVRILNEPDTSLWESRWFSTGNEPLVLPETPMPLMPLNQENDVDNHPLLVWTNAGGAVEYHLQISDSPMSLESAPIQTSSMNEVGVNNLNYLETYYWRVRSSDGNLVSNWSEVFSFTTGQQVLGVPILLSPDSGVTDQEVALLYLDWTDVPDAEIYEIELATDANFLFNLIQDVVWNSEYYAVNLLPGETYFWRVKASHSVLIPGAWAESWSFATLQILETPALVSPINEATNQPVNNLILEWDEVTHAEAYELEYALDEYFLVNVVSEVNTNSYFVLSGLSYSETYYWRVRATASGFYPSDWTYGWQFTTEGEIGIISEAEASFKLYPNPASTEFYLSGLEHGDWIRVFDVSGRMLHEEQSAGDFLRLSVSTWQSGLYFISVNRGAEQWSKRLIITR